MIRYLSVCSGIEAASCAWKELGWEPVAFSEIDAFPCKVLKHHYPDVPNLGDMTKIDGRSYRGRVDLLVGGTPCQDFSIANKNRDGLNGERSGLARHFIRLIREINPKWFVWENVPGAFSSNGGGDFRAIIKEMDESGYSLAWRVLNAEYFGVPQRRRRIYIVGYSGKWTYPAEVLFERESMCRDTSESREKRKEIARCLTRGTCQRYDFETENFVIGTLNASGAGTSRPAGQVNELDFCIPSNIGVRRLTPLECERLQGFPDGWTDIENASDTARYKALGNSMAVPVMRWIGERIEKVSNENSWN